MIVDKAEILPLICYEIIFPEILQNYKKNTNLIINISEDGWFGNTIGPFQHFIKAKYRAIENNVFLIRSANKGISAFIDNKGNVIKALSSTEAGGIELDVPILNTKTKNKNDLIFYLLLITYTFIFLLLRKYEKNKYLFTSESVSRAIQTKFVIVYQIWWLIAIYLRTHILELLVKL